MDFNLFCSTMSLMLISVASVLLFTTEKVHSAELRVENTTRSCNGVRPGSQTEFNKLVMEYDSDGNWSSFRRRVDSLMDHDSEAYSQFQTINWDNVWARAEIGMRNLTDMAALLICGGLSPSRLDLPDHEVGPGLTMIHTAASFGNLVIVKMVVEHGASMEVRSSQGYTPLILAARGDLLPEVKYLVEAGADVSATDNEGLTALDHARMSGALQVEQYLSSLTS